MEKIFFTFWLISCFTCIFIAYDSSSHEKKSLRIASLIFLGLLVLSAFVITFIHNMVIYAYVAVIFFIVFASILITAFIISLVKDIVAGFLEEYNKNKRR